MKKFYDLAIFHPMIMGEEYLKVKQAIQNMICCILLLKLNRKQKSILNVRNYHSWDPNYPEKGKIQGLLEHLIFDALASGSSLNYADHFYSQLFLYDLKKFTGVSDVDIFSIEIKNINERWKQLAEIKIVSITKNHPVVSFKLL
jgi:hypothetical protein